MVLRYIKLSLLAFIFLWSGVSFAQYDEFGVVPQDNSAFVTPPKTITPGTSTSESLVRIGNAIEAKLATMSAGLFVPIGLEILGIFLVLNFVWLIVKGIATGRMLDAFLSDFLPVGVGAAAAYVFINGAGGQTNNLIQVITKVVTHLGSMVAPGVYGQSLGSIIGDAVGSTIASLIDILAVAKSASIKAGLGINNILFGGMAVAIIGILIKVLFSLAVVVFILVALGIFIGTLVISQVTFAIAAIFMPLFVPFLIFKPLSGMFDAWLKFFITAGFTKIIGLMMLNITQIILLEMSTVSANVAANASVEYSDLPNALGLDIVNYSSLALMAAVCCLLMLQVKTIASGLIGAIAVGFEGWGSLNKGLMSQGPMGGMGKAVSNLGTGASNGIKAGTNSLSSVATQAPNFAKSSIQATGSALASVRGNVAARSHINAVKDQQKSFVGPSQPGVNTGGSLNSDISKMSPAAQGAYTKHVEAQNVIQKANGEKNFTIPASNVSSTSPKHPDNTPSSQPASQPKPSTGNSQGTTQPPPTPQQQAPSQAQAQSSPSTSQQPQVRAQSSSPPPAPTAAPGPSSPSTSRP